MTEQILAMAADQNVRSAQSRKPTRRDRFLATMEKILRLAEPCSVSEPHDPKAGKGNPLAGGGVRRSVIDL
jgi:IS5 family transposase